MASTCSRAIGAKTFLYLFNVPCLSKSLGYELYPTFSTAAVLDFKFKTWTTPQTPSDLPKLCVFSSSSTLDLRTFIAQGSWKWSSEWRMALYRLDLKTFALRAIGGMNGSGCDGARRRSQFSTCHWVKLCLYMMVSCFLCILITTLLNENKIKISPRHCL